MTRLSQFVICTLVLIVWAFPLAGQSGNVAALVRQADTAFDDEDRNLARKLYQDVVALDPEQSHAVYRLGQLAAAGETALTWFQRYVKLEPDDAWGWIALGKGYLRVGKAVEARDAFRRAAKLAPEAEEIQPNLEKARLRAAPILEPLGGFAGDSDGNITWKSGLSVDTAIRSGLRIGGRASRSLISDSEATATLDEGVFRLQGRPRTALRLDFSGGVARLASPTASAWATPVADVRLRWNSAGNAGSFEVRGMRTPLGTTPLLVANRAMRNELRLSGTVPLGPVRLRAGARAGGIETAVEEQNQKLQGDAALVFPVSWRGEFSAQYHRIGFRRASQAGYFAPKSVETIEGGSYWQVGGDGRWSAEVDLGAGMQRLAIQEQAVGAWKPALRAWGMWSVDLTRTVAFRTEVEGYSAPFAPAGVSTAPNWHYVALSFGLALRVF